MARVVLTAGLNYGDEGKGTTVDFLCRHLKAGLVVRYNGGAQAAHNVVTRDGAQHHTFAQFGSGTYAGARTHLSRYMLVNPITLLKEADALIREGEDPFARLTVEGDALVTTPFHVSANRLREMMRTGRHGSCGMGIGETMQDFVEFKECLYVRDLYGDKRDLQEKLERIMVRKTLELMPLMDDCPKPYGYDEWKFLLGGTGAERVSTIKRIMDLYAAFTDKAKLVGPEWLEMMLESNTTIVFEGAQGVLLDQDMGFQPYTTWTDCTFGNAEKLLNGWKGEVKKLGIVRAYMTRHGAGPFVSEDNARFDTCSAYDHNKHGEWQGTFRSGAFDLVATKYALKVIGKIDGLVMTHLDRVTNLEEIPVCWAYKGQGVTIGELLPNTPFNLEYQGELAKMLLKATPILSNRREHGNDYAQGVADTLGVDLAITSYGPTADEKRIVSDLFPGSV